MLHLGISTSTSLLEGVVFEIQVPRNPGLSSSTRVCMCSHPILLAQLRLGNRLFLTNATGALRQESLHPSKQLSFSWGLILSKMDLLIIEGVAGTCGSGYGLLYFSLRELYIWPRILIVFGLFVA